MRDPKRIRPFLERLALVWETVPDWRFGQLIINIFGDISYEVDPWFPEDDKLIEMMERRMYHGNEQTEQN